MSLAPFGEEDAQAIDLVKKLEAPAIAVLNKVDKLHDKPQLLALIERFGALHPVRRIHPDLRDERHRRRYAASKKS